VTMPKKGSRKVIVGEMEFRYRIGPRRQADVVYLAVEASMSPASVLSVAFSFRDPWLYFKDGGPFDKPLKPNAVQTVIEEALRLGWKPSKPGPAFKATLAQDGTLTVSD